jgi:hypothetical protein
MKVQKGSGGTALLVFNLGARYRWVVNATPRSSYPRKRAPVTILEEAGWDLGSLDPNGFTTPNRPLARSEKYVNFKDPKFLLCYKFWCKSGNDLNKSNNCEMFFQIIL